MKKAGFYKLLYREVLIVRKNLLLAVITSMSISIICILAALSFQYGNLALLKDQLEVDGLIGRIQLFAECYAIIASGMICFSVVEGSVKDTSTRWDHFRRSTPVSCVRLMLSRYVILGATILVSYTFSLASTALISSILYSRVTTESFALCVVGTTALVVINIIAHSLIIYFKSLDKAMITVMCILVLVIITAVIVFSTADVSIEKILVLCVDILPFIPFIIAGTVLAGYVSATLLAKRREK